MLFKDLKALIDKSDMNDDDKVLVVTHDQKVLEVKESVNFTNSLLFYTNKEKSSES